MSARPDDKQDLILDAAIRVFNTRGFAQARLSDVAEEAGVAKGTLYLYFSSKEDLFREAMMREFRRYERETGQIAMNNQFDRQMKLEAICAYHLQYFRERKNWRFWMMNNYEHDQDTNKEMQAFLQRFLAMLIDLMGDGKKHEQAHIRAMAFMGVMESFKNELFLVPDELVNQEWIQARSSFSAELFETVI